MSNGKGGTLVAFIYVTTLFFAWGFVTSIIDPLIPAVRSIFTLNFAESMLTQFAWFIAYGVASLPAAALLARMGFSNSIIVALATMVAGCLIMPLATGLDLYPGVLLSLFVIASGVTLLQVAANPLVAALGPSESSHFRLTLSQAFNSLGTVIGPYLGATIMLSGGLFGASATLDANASRAESLRSIDFQFFVVAAFFALLALFIFSVRQRIAASAPPTDPKLASPWAAFKSGWALFGGLAIFLYVGAEVAIASVMINFLLHINFIQYASGFVAWLGSLGLVDSASPPAEIAGKILGLCYWFGAMVGRFVGSALLTRMPAGALLAFNALVNTILCLIVTQVAGPVAGVAALSAGFFNSIMFPCIFTLTLSRSSAPTSAVSGLLCMAIVGGAALPWLTGRVADAAGLNLAFVVPLLGYIGIVVFALAAARAKAAQPGAVAAPAAGH
ncbi:MAG TPA: MFS transporter [Caulobacterales bacterium]|nr:MFS transporter [Caulobacterales bacterium]